MAYLLAIVAGIAGAVVGWLVTGALTAWIAGAMGMSDFEGGRAMFAFLAIGPLGGLVGMGAAAWAVLRRTRGRAPIGRTVARLAGVAAGIAALVAAAIGIRFLTLDTYTDELPPDLQFELRIPATQAAVDRDQVRVELHTDRNVGDGIITGPWSRAEDGHQVIAGVVPLAYKTRSRLLVVTLGDAPTRLFQLPLGRDPSSTPALGAWQHATHLDARGGAQPVPAPKDDPVELRYRVRRAGEE